MVGIDIHHVTKIEVDDHYYIKSCDRWCLSLNIHISDPKSEVTVALFSKKMIEFTLPAPKRSSDASS